MHNTPPLRPFGLEDKIEFARMRVAEAELRADLNPGDVIYQFALDARRIELAVLEHAWDVKQGRCPPHEWHPAPGPIPVWRMNKARFQCAKCSEKTVLTREQYFQKPR